MTNSKQYCDYCGERYSAAHKDCRSERRPLRNYYRMVVENTNRISSVRENEDGTIHEIFPEMGRQHKNLEAWKEFFYFSVKNTIIETQR